MMKLKVIFSWLAIISFCQAMEGKEDNSLLSNINNLNSKQNSNGESEEEASLLLIKLSNMDIEKVGNFQNFSIEFQLFPKAEQNYYSPHYSSFVVDLPPKGEGIEVSCALDQKKYMSAYYRVNGRTEYAYIFTLKDINNVRQINIFLSKDLDNPLKGWPIPSYQLLSFLDLPQCSDEAIKRINEKFESGEYTIKEPKGKD